MHFAGELLTCTASDLFSGHGYSGNDCFSGTKPLDDAILFTNSRITALVELFFGKIPCGSKQWQEFEAEKDTKTL